VVPVLLSRLGVQAIKEAIQIGDVQQTVLNGAGAERSAKDEIPVAPFGSGAAEMPDHARILVGLNFSTAGI